MDGVVRKQNLNLLAILGAMEVSGATLPLLSVVTVVVILMTFLRRNSPKKRRPPGPSPLPLVGSLHLLTSQPQVALRELAKAHGPVMSVRLGMVDTVVITSAAAAREVLRDKDICFASRPSIVLSEIFIYGNLDVAFAPYGAYWRMLRKICAVELLSPQKVRQLAPIRDAETMRLVGKIRDAGEREPVNLGKLLVSASNAVTGASVFGQVCGRELEEQFLSVLDVGQKISGGFCVSDLFPPLWFVDVVTGLRSRLWRARRQLDDVLDRIIAECEARRGDDLLTVLLRIRDEGGYEQPIGATNVKAIIMDMFTGGTETTSSSAEWLMSELAKHPEAMAKAQAEVRRTFDGKSPQDHENHLEELRYTRMVVKESMRLHPVLPLLVPRVCRETCDVGGFEVAKGTRVMVNAWAIARDPQYWPNAEEFRPTRFEDGAADDRSSRFEYLPFGSGRRMCPGSTFGLVTLELIVARLLYYFDWSLPAGMKPDDLDMDMLVGATVRKKNPLHLVASPYKGVSL